MRFASKSQRYKREVRKPILTLVQGPAGPEQKAIRDNFIAEFEQAGLTEHEKQQVRERFTFLGQYEGEDPMRRVSIYDTDDQARIHGWDDEMKADIEANLLEGQNEFYFKLEDFRLPKPWPKYDDLRSAEKIAETVKSLGLDAEAVIAYEKENKNREAVISALSEESEPLVTA